MGRVEQDHVLHVLVDVPWVRLNEVKGVVGDDPTDPVVLGDKGECWVWSNFTALSLKSH